MSLFEQVVDPFEQMIDVLSRFAGWLTEFDGVEEHSLSDLLADISLAASGGGAKVTPGKDLPRAFGQPSGASRWSLQFVGIDDGIHVLGLQYQVDEYDRMILEELEVRRVEVEDPVLAGGRSVRLPLEETYRVGSSMSSGAKVLASNYHPYHRLRTSVDHSYVLLYAHVVHADGSLTALAPEDVEVDDLLDRIEQGALPVQTDGSVVVFTVFELALCSPKADFEPFGVAEMVRCYPLVSCWSSRDLAKIRAEIKIARPPTSWMMEAHGNGEIYTSFYTDRNSDEEMTIWSLGTPYWDRLFDHYRLEGEGTAAFQAIGDRSERVDSATRKVRRYVDEDENPLGVSYLETTPVKKLSKQGVFDNVHMAPAMKAIAGRGFMAPVCQHDCLHLHWRWSSGYRAKGVLGWSGGWPSKLDGPNEAAGAPMIPPNQTLEIEPLADRPGILYRATAQAAEFEDLPQSRRWHVFFHHGFGYVTGFEMTAMSLVAQAGFFLVGDGDFYFSLRFARGNTRIDESVFSTLENL